MKNSNSTRRNFILNTSKAAIALGLSSTSASIFANTLNQQVEATAEKFTQQALPYKFGDLQVAIDAQTMEIHYSKHAAAYCKNLNEAYFAEIGTKNKSLEEILTKVSKYSPKMRNNAGGHFNHEMFWKCMSANPAIDKPSGILSEKIATDFGSIEAFKTQFNEVAKTRFGSGWAWLIKGKDGKLAIGSTPNQDNPLMNVSELKGSPLLCLDVWEHAYYLRYQNKRAEYIANWWKIVDWGFVEKRYEEA